MPAIITNEFRLDATQRFVDSITSDNYYIALGKAMGWVDGDIYPEEPYENNHTGVKLWDNIYALKKVALDEMSSVSPGKLWVSGGDYSEYDDRAENLEGSTVQYFVITTNNNVYICLKSGPAGSLVNPDIVGMTTEPVVLSDGYKWKYLFTTSIGGTDKFLTTDFIPVRKIITECDNADSACIAQTAVQATAADGAIYNIKLLTGGDDYIPDIVNYTIDGINYPNAAKMPSTPGAPANNELEVSISGNGTGATAFATMVIDSTSGSPVVTGTIEDIIIYTPGVGYQHVLVSINGSGGTGATARGVLGPAGGFGADPRRDLRSHYVAINKVFQGTDNLPNSNDFRQIAIIKNPTEPDGTQAIAEMYIGTNRLIVPAQLNSGGSSYFTDDLLISGTISGAKAYVVTYDNTTGIIYYSQDETTGYTSFVTSDIIRNDADNTGGYSLNEELPMMQSDIARYSGQVLFVENRTAVSRGTDQLETIRLVLAF